MHLIIHQLKEKMLLKKLYKAEVQSEIRSIESLYQTQIQRGIAKECARVFLPEGLVMSRLYANATMRDWFHYLDVRDDEGVTQWEHVLLARAIREQLAPTFPALFGGHA